MHLGTSCKITSPTDKIDLFISITYDPLSDAIVFRHMIKINDGIGFHHNVVLHPFLGLFS